MARISAREIDLFARNTGELYPTHLAMARSHATAAMWATHIRRRVLPRYSKDVEPATASRDAIQDAAKQLADYYARHIAEGA